MKSYGSSRAFYLLGPSLTIQDSYKSIQSWLLTLSHFFKIQNLKFISDASKCWGLESTLHLSSSDIFRNRRCCNRHVVPACPKVFEGGLDVFPNSAGWGTWGLYLSSVSIFSLGGHLSSVKIVYCVFYILAERRERGKMFNNLEMLFADLADIQCWYVLLQFTNIRN